MLSRHPTLLPRALTLLTASVLLLPLPRMIAADDSGETEVVEMEIDEHSEVGKLKPLNRVAEPEVDAASDAPVKAMARMKLPAGLQVSLFAAEPMLANPVAFNFDEQGRIFVSETYRYGSSTLDIRDYMWLLEDDLANRTQEDFLATIQRRFGPQGTADLSVESERIRLLTDTNGDGVADQSSFYAEGFRTPMDGVASSVLAHRGSVWFTNIPSLWKFTGRDRAEKREELFRGFGLRFNYTGHDLHGLTLGPDGRIYFSIGDRAAHVTTKEGGVVAIPDTGGVFRVWPDGSGFELFASGLRNPQSLLFNEYGDLFTGDNDSDQGDEERLVHVVEGGDSGWRVGYQHAPRGNAGPWNTEKLWHPRHAGQPAYILPPICNIEDGPSGVAYYPGTGLTPAFAHTIFITHFKGSVSNSGIYAYKVKPDGASYAIDTAAPFLTGALPTDVRFGPDGRIYYSDWAEGWPKSKRGRIYAIFDPTYQKQPIVAETKALIASDFTKKSDDELAGLLAHPDWRVRLEAQYSLAERASGPARFAAVVNGADELARRHAVWGLRQAAHFHAPVLELLRPLLNHADSEVRAQAANALGDLRDAASAAALTAALTDAAPRVRFFAAQALGKIKVPAATAALLAALKANDNHDLYLRHALVLGLVGCATPAELAATATDDSAAVRLGAVLALRRLAHADVARFLTDRDPLIVREAATAIHDEPINAAMPAIAAFIAHPVANDFTMLRALDAAFRLGGAEHAAALAEFAAQENPAPLRREALALLARWPQPPARDRLVGIYRPLEKSRPVAEAAGALQSKLSHLLAVHTPDNVQLAAIDAAVGLNLTAALPELRATVADAAQTAAVRTAALNALDKLKDPELLASARLAAQSDQSELRLAALPLTTRLLPQGAVPVLADLIARGTGREQQAAFQALGVSTDPAAADLLLVQLARLASGEVAPMAQLDLLDATAKHSDPRIKQALADRDAALARNPDPLAPFRVCLEGGNPRNATRIFMTNPVIQCARCHRVGDYPGGEAGPNLAGIGTRGTREYILESIIKPSAKIAKGFEVVTVTKQDGQTAVGTVLERNDHGIRLKSGDDVIEVPAAAIKSVESAPSAMPEVAALVLSKAEIRDLIEGLSMLKTPASHEERTLRALRHRDE